MLARLDRGLRLALETITAGLLAALVLVCFTEVVLRYGLGRSLGWYDEFAGYLLVWLTFLGAALAQQQERHIGVEVVTGPRMKLLAHALLMLVQVVLAYHGARLAVSSWSDRAIMLPLPMGFLYAVVPVSAAITLLVQAIQVEAILSRRGRP